MKEKLKKTAKRIFFLSPVLTVLIAIFSFSFMIAALTGRVRAVALEYFVIHAVCICTCHQCNRDCQAYKLCT